MFCCSPFPLVFFHTSKTKAKPALNNIKQTHDNTRNNHATHKRHEHTHKDTRTHTAKITIKNKYKPILVLFRFCLVVCHHPSFLSHQEHANNEQQPARNQAINTAQLKRHTHKMTPQRARQQQRTNTNSKTRTTSTSRA